MKQRQDPNIVHRSHHRRHAHKPVPTAPDSADRAVDFEPGEVAGDEKDVESCPRCEELVHNRKGKPLHQYLRVVDVRRSQFKAMLDLAAEYRSEPLVDRKLLRGESVLLHFAKPSTRTRLAFQTAVTRLGGESIVTGPNDLQLGRGETISDTAQVVGRMCAAAALRVFDHNDVEQFATASSVPTINMLSDMHHPSQALADLLTVRDAFGTLKGVKVAYLGAGNNVCHSLMEACALLGVDLSVATPEDFRPNTTITTRAAELAAIGRSALVVGSDVQEATRGASVIYTDVWLSMGDDPTTVEHRRAALAPFRVTEEVFRAAEPDAIFLHCLPAHRGDEVVAEVIDGRRSRVFDQAENRLHTAHAILASCFKKM